MRDINSRGALGLGEGGRVAFGPGGAQLVLFGLSSEGMTGPISKWKSWLRRGKDQPKVSQLGQAAREPPAQPVTSYFQAITCPQPLPPPAQTPSQHALFPGIVAVTHVLAYLETVTGRGSQDARLQTLACSLDPNGEGPQATVDLDTFLVVMRDWIATCQLDGWVPVPTPTPGSPS